jgi:LacI family transcriptional regulator
MALSYSISKTWQDYRGYEADQGARPTVNNIADHAGVAPMSVSRVINSSGYVSAEMRENALRAVRELDCRPNGLARSLRSRRTKVVGIV